MTLLWRWILRRPTIRNWTTRSWSLGMRKRDCPFRGSGAIEEWKCSNLKTGDTSPSFCARVVAGASPEKSYGGSGKPLKYGNIHAQYPPEEEAPRRPPEPFAVPTCLAMLCVLGSIGNSQSQMSFLTCSLGRRSSYTPNRSETPANVSVNLRSEPAIDVSDIVIKRMPRITTARLSFANFVLQ